MIKRKIVRGALSNLIVLVAAALICVNAIPARARQSGAGTTTTAQTSQAGNQAGAAGQKKDSAQAAEAYFTNTVLINQDNKPMRFYQDLLKGKIVLINFMLTHCKGACSPMTANLAKVQKYLGERVGQEVRMISISVEPEVDTAASLKKYAEGFKAQPGWYFLTGNKKNVDTVLTKLGGHVDDPQQHSLVLIIGNEATGEWVKVHAMSNPTEIADAVMKLLPGKKS